jgi:hypothetical protein
VFTIQVFAARRGAECFLENRKGQTAEVTMPQIVDTIDPVVYHGDYLYKPSENTVLVVYGGLVKEAAVIGSDDPLVIAKQLLRALVAYRQTATQL